MIKGSWEDVDRSTSRMHLFHLGMLSPLIPLLISGVAGLNIVLPRQTLGGNTSALPPGWNVNPGTDCLADVGNLLGPSFTDPVGLTIESCVAFCDSQSQRLAGLEGDQCKCANIYRPDGGGFESDPGECHTPYFDVPCPGNAEESCGLPNGTPSLISLYLKKGTPIDCSDLVWPGGAAMTAGKWRFSYFYNDSTTARALSVNAANLAVPTTAGNMSSAACTTACGNAGFTLAGVEFGDECFCGNALQNGAHTITDCALLNQPFNPNPARVSLTTCTGNAQEICGGPGVISIFTLPGTGLIPLLPFNPSLDNFCAGENCMTET